MDVEQLMERAMEAAEQGDGEGPVGGMVVGGVDLRDLQRSHAERPSLARWLETSIKLIPDFYETQETLVSQKAQLEEVIKAQAKQLKELKDKYEPEQKGSAADPLADPEEAAAAARTEVEARQDKN